ncbi:hypothetical protein CSA56_04605 [candidate division KSB3 bacterium]|uniref:Uncharacterized protein n=1 Tax=candidate division KSB3 bacterium TaxID=2044937 RepID=A0A2G6KJU5_9BACT|nr:MAG: hypothetical protein CSA56_04605 [candidate division KSB3 bacterium]
MKWLLFRVFSPNTLYSDSFRKMHMFTTRIEWGIFPQWSFVREIATSEWLPIFLLTSDCLTFFVKTIFKDAHSIDIR